MGKVFRNYFSVEFHESDLSLVILSGKNELRIQSEC